MSFTRHNVPSNFIGCQLIYRTKTGNLRIARVIREIIRKEVNGDLIVKYSEPDPDTVADYRTRSFALSRLVACDESSRNAFQGCTFIDDGSPMLSGMTTSTWATALEHYGLTDDNYRFPHQKQLKRSSAQG